MSSDAALVECAMSGKMPQDPKGRQAFFDRLRNGPPSKPLSSSSSSASMPAAKGPEPTMTPAEAAAVAGDDAAGSDSEASGAESISAYPYRRHRSPYRRYRRGGYYRSPFRRVPYGYGYGYGYGYPRRSRWFCARYPWLCYPPPPPPIVAPPPVYLANSIHARSKVRGGPFHHIGDMYGDDMGSSYRKRSSRRRSSRRRSRSRSWSRSRSRSYRSRSRGRGRRYRRSRSRRSRSRSRSSRRRRSIVISIERGMSGGRGGSSTGGRGYTSRSYRQPGQQGSSSYKRGHGASVVSSSSKSEVRGQTQLPIATPTAGGHRRSSSRSWTPGKSPRGRRRSGSRGRRTRSRGSSRSRSRSSRSRSRSRSGSRRRGGSRRSGSRRRSGRRSGSRRRRGGSRRRSGSRRGRSWSARRRGWNRRGPGRVWNPALGLYVALAPPLYAVPPPPPPPVLVTTAPERIVYVPGTNIPPGWTDKGLYAMPPGPNTAVPDGYYITNDGRLAQQPVPSAGAMPPGAAMMPAGADPYTVQPTYIPESEQAMYSELPGIASNMQYRELVEQKRNIESKMDSLARDLKQKLTIERDAKIAAGLGSTAEFDRVFGIKPADASASATALDAKLQRK